MKHNILDLFLLIIISILKFALCENEASVSIECNGNIINLPLDDFLTKDNTNNKDDCNITIGEGSLSYPLGETSDKKITPFYNIIEISGKYVIEGQGRDKSFFECPNSNKKTIFSIGLVDGSITFKNLSFRNCGKKNKYLPAIKIENTKSIKFINCDFFDMEIPAILAINSSVDFENIYVHDILYDSFNITNSGDLDKGIINITQNSATSIKNSKLYGCPEECKNYNLYISDGTTLNINNCEFKNAAGGIYINKILYECTINNSIFRDHDMALIKNSKYEPYSLSPGAMYGGAIYISEANEFKVINTSFINNAVNEQGGAVYMTLYNGSPKITFKNVTLKNNFSFSEGRDLIVNGDTVKVSLEDIRLTGGRDPRWTEDIKPSFMFLSKIEVNITDISVYDFYSNGTIINIEQATGSTINNFKIENSVFDGILESQCNININNLKIINSISQGGYADKKSLPAFNIKMNTVEINNSVISGFSSKSTVFNVQSYGELKIHNTNITDLYAKETIITRSYIGALKEDPTPLIIDNCKFNSVSSSSSMLNLETGAWCNIINSSFENIGFCPSDITNKYCENTDTGSFASLIHTAALNITNSTITNSKATNGGLFFIKHEPHLYLNNVIITNSEATEYGGVFWFGDFGGSININNCLFTNCKAEKGGVLAMSRNSHLVRDESWKTDFTITFNKCEFIGNIAEYGGVYFIGENSNPKEGIAFRNSLFENNYADAGGVGVCINETTIPILENNISKNNSALYYASEFGYQPNEIDLLSVIPAHSSSSDNPLYEIPEFKNDTNYFVSRITIQEAKNFKVEYTNYTKIVTVGDEQFLLLQDGADYEYYQSHGGKEFDSNKIIYVPIEKTGIYDKSVVPYIELLEKRTTISAFRNIKFTTSYCIQNIFTTTENIAEFTPDQPENYSEQLQNANVIFGKIEGKNNGINMSNYVFKEVPFNAISEETPLGRAEWIKFVAMFYNEEKLAEKLFDLVKEDYNKLKETVKDKKPKNEPTKIIAWVSYDYLTEIWTFETSKFYETLTSDSGSKLYVPSTNSNKFLNSISKNVDFVIDISPTGTNDDIDDFFKNSGLTKSSCTEYVFCKNNNIMKFNKRKNEYNYDVWDEFLLPMANTLLIELQTICYPEIFNNKETDIWYHSTYLRRISDSQYTILTSKDCYDPNSSVIYERYATEEDLDIETYSGDWIPYSFMLGIKTYNGTNFKSKNDETTADGALFVTVVIVDRNNTVKTSDTSTIYGKKRWRCNLANSTCSIPANEFQVIGDYGEYTLNFTIIENENWQFDTLINAYASVNITIKECNRKKNVDITNTQLKSCYDPDCPGGCLHQGTCVDLNTCECQDNWQGPNCNERVKFVVPKWLQYMFLVIGITSAILCCILILMLYLRRNLQHVRSSSPLFLMIMTIGAVCNSGTIILESRNDSIAICILREWCKYIGFSLMVGALIVKTIRISLIFSGKKIGGSQLADKRLIVYLFGILIPFIILLIIWTTVDPVVMKQEERSEKEFTKCSSHSTSIIGDVFLFAILFWAVHAAYTARNAPSAFNETKAIVLSTYVYFIIEVLVIVLQNLGSFDPTVSMTINCLATLVSTWCCLLFILKPKMKNVNSQMTPSQYSSASHSQSEAYNSTIGSASMGTTSIGVKSGRL